MSMSRRDFITAGGAGITLALLPVPSFGAITELLDEDFGARRITQDRVKLKVPALAENGNSVPLDISVDSPMSETDYVRAIHVYAEKNPLPRVATYHLFPGTGKADISTRIRYADSQTIVAVAEMSDGSLWSGAGKTIVTLAACVEQIL